jgi:mannose-1-phosphate guanylyltransferase
MNKQDKNSHTAKELIEKRDYYFNEKGLFVFTEKYHLEKGYCCGMACRHCPYHYEAVPEPKRSEALLKRGNTNFNELHEF